MRMMILFHKGGLRVRPTKEFAFYATQIPYYQSGEIRGKKSHLLILSGIPMGMVVHSGF
jgi:hypothetical protein